MPLVMGLFPAIVCVGIVAWAQEPAAPTPGEVGVAAAPTGQTGFSGSVKAAEAGSPAIRDALIQYTGPNNTTGQVKTSTTGEFEVVDVPAGTYLLTVSANEFTTRQSQPVTVVDGAVTPVELKLRRRETVITAYRKLGIMGPFQVVGSILAVTFIIERFLAYGRLNRGNNELVQRVSDALSRNSATEAVQACEERGTPLGNVLKAGLLRFNQAKAQGREAPKEDIQESMQEAALMEIPEYERNLQWLSTIGVVMPLLGLTGTVTGMIKSFTVIALEGTNDPNALAGGISEALYTTAFGLFVAAPTIVFYAFFENVVNRSSVQIEVAATDTANALIEPQA
jgi:biopolymer transport protein ExbB